MTGVDGRNLVLAALAFAIAALLPFVDTGYWLIDRRIYSPLYHRAHDLLDALQRADELYLAGDGSVLRASAYVVAAGLSYASFPVLVAVCRSRHGGVRRHYRPCDAAHLRRVFRHLHIGARPELVRQIVSWAQHVMGSSSGL